MRAFTVELIVNLKCIIRILQVKEFTVGSGETSPSGITNCALIRGVSYSIVVLIRTVLNGEASMHNKLFSLHLYPHYRYIPNVLINSAVSYSIPEA